ncbi:MAG TPA: hypothetical protein VFV32_07045 [Acidimicrobiales bacterium]|nr:hypothetical protein [Acidimicrobiales bacterium]
MTATARRPLLRRLPPLALVQLRLAGAPDWPANPALAAPRFRTQLRPDGFTVRGTIQGRRLEVTVALLGGEQRWVVDGRAHAEVGTRPAAPGSS